METQDQNVQVIRLDRKDTIKLAAFCFAMCVIGTLCALWIKKHL